MKYAKRNRTLKSKLITCYSSIEMKKIYQYSVIAWLSLLLWASGVQALSEKKVDSVSERESSKTVTFIFAGDIMGHMPQIEAAYNKESGSYDFLPCYQFIAPYIRTADLAMANLEVPLAGKPYSGYPRFSSPEALLDGALSAGFGVMQLANNHAADRGGHGIESTIEAVSRRVQCVGSYLNEAQRDTLYPLIVNVKGLRTAILNCTFDTNGNPVPKPFIVNLIDTAQIHRDVARARREGAKFVIMTIHWGTEYELKANEEQRQLARYFANTGIDLIIGSHPHVVQNFEYVYRQDSVKVPVYYSLGNMISNQRKENSNGGILAKVTVDVKSHKAVQCTYLPFYVYKGDLNGKMQYYIIPTQWYSSQRDIELPSQDVSALKLFESNTLKRLSHIETFGE